MKKLFTESTINWSGKSINIKSRNNSEMNYTPLKIHKTSKVNIIGLLNLFT